MFRDIPIKKKLVIAMLVICGAVLCITCASFYTYEYITVKRNSEKQLSIISQIIATNSTAALAFNDEDAAQETLNSLKAQPRITAACLYNAQGKPFAKYPASAPDSVFPKQPDTPHYVFHSSYIDGFENVEQAGKMLGTLYIKSDLKTFQDRMKVLALLSLGLLFFSLLIASFLSDRFQSNISKPILAMVNTSRSISESHDYSKRAQKFGNDELGMLTDSFNNMLSQIESQNDEITSFSQLMEHKVEARTLELENANRELESFSYSVSHDLRAPLRKINAFINLLVDHSQGTFSDEHKALLARIVANSNKMGRLIDDLLDFARMGKLQLDRKLISMDQIVKQLTDEVVKHDESRKIDVVIHELPDAYADPTSITQVWDNLISNAVKYTSNEAVAHIEIGATDNGENNTYWIKDNGAGFEMQHYDKLFTAFERLHSVNEFEGTGVGLAIVQRIIEKHGGRIWAESEKDKGATFFFSLPKGERENTEAANAATTVQT